MQTTEPLNENHDDFSRLLVIVLWIMFGFLHRLYSLFLYCQEPRWLLSWTKAITILSQGDYYLEPRRLLSWTKAITILSQGDYYLEPRRLLSWAKAITILSQGDYYLESRRLLSWAKAITILSQGDYYLETRRLLSCLKVSVVIDMHFMNNKRFQLKILLIYWRKLSNLKPPTSRMACPGVSTLTAHFRF